MVMQMDKNVVAGHSYSVVGVGLFEQSNVWLTGNPASAEKNESISLVHSWGCAGPVEPSGEPAGAGT
ncbi:uncharacterized protein N7473_010610 [Penicillium subrubescens]|uniref:uncharacterized protein n=1 Tax=Penicillium subrubescens TaxID=1316194 RepID=UPI00254564ED|nr:uncharacterized protein N7473_010610 [Penicillium subrubescens]KAJ5883724.1 hypothetical protein N7473_010610 [Penicillium subrubescens]